MTSVDDQIRKTASEMVVQSSETIENLRIEKSDLQTEVKRLKEITDSTFDAGVRKGMEAAEEIAKDEKVWGPAWDYQNPPHQAMLFIVAAIEAAKEQQDG